MRFLPRKHRKPPTVIVVLIDVLMVVLIFMVGLHDIQKSGRRASRFARVVPGTTGGGGEQGTGHHRGQGGSSFLFRD